jgi:hypothetical protein
MYFSRKRVDYLIILFVSISFLYSCKSDDDGGTTPIEIDFSGELVWVKTFGGSNEDDAIDMVQANDGNYVVLGFTNSNDGDVTGKTTTDQDYWLLKINQDGEKLWDKTYGGSGDDQATGISKTNDGGYIISGFTASSDGDVSENAGFHDYWIVKVNNTGDIEWEKSFGFIGQDQAYQVIQTFDGGYFATGFLDVGLSEGQGNDFNNDPSNTRESLHSLGDYWGIKMDANGNKIWRQYFGGTHVDQSKDVLQTDDGGFLLAGISESADFDITNAHGANDFWVIKVSADGDKVWENSYGGAETDRAFSFVKATDGNYILTGESRSIDADVSNSKGGGDIWIVKFNASNGAIIWERSYGGTEFDTSRGIANLDNGYYAIAGSSRSSNVDVSVNYGANDAWFILIDENGNLEFEKNIGGSNIDFANKTKGTTENEIIVVGSSLSNDEDILINKGNKDLLIFKMK